MTGATCHYCGAPLPDRAFQIREVAIVLAGPPDERAGLLAWAQLRVGPFHLEGLSVRRTLGGEIAVTIHARKDRRGTLHPQITLLDADLERRIRVAVTTAYIAERAKHGRRVP
jgi:hypothetical protein